MIQSPTFTKCDKYHVILFKLTQEQAINIQLRVLNKLDVFIAKIQRQDLYCLQLESVPTVQFIFSSIKNLPKQKITIDLDNNGLKIQLSENNNLEVKLKQQYFHKENNEINSISTQDTLLNFIILQSIQYSSEISHINKLFENISQKYENQVIQLKKRVNQLQILNALQNQHKEDKIKGNSMNKHRDLQIYGNRIVSNVINYQIKWLVFGEQLSRDKNTFVVFKINKINWICLGVCLKDIIHGRNYSRLNGNLGHGSYVIDNNGWVYAHDIQDYNYKQFRFNFNQNDVVTMKYSPTEYKLSFSNENSLQRWQMLLEDENVYSVCVGCIMQTDITVIDRFERFQDL